MLTKKKTQERLKKCLQGFFAITLSTVFAAAMPAIGLAATSPFRATEANKRELQYIEQAQKIYEDCMKELAYEGVDFQKAQEACRQKAHFESLSQFTSSTSSEGESDYRNQSHTQVLTEGNTEGDSMTISESSDKNIGWSDGDSIFKEMVDSKQFSGRGFAYVANYILNSDNASLLTADEQKFLQRVAQNEPDAVAQFAGMGSYEFFEDIATEGDREMIQKYTEDSGKHLSSFAVRIGSEIIGAENDTMRGTTGTSSGTTTGESYSRAGDYGDPSIPSSNGYGSGYSHSEGEGIGMANSTVNTIKGNNSFGKSENFSHNTSEGTSYSEATGQSHGFSSGYSNTISEGTNVSGKDIPTSDGYSSTASGSTANSESTGTSEGTSVATSSSTASKVAKGVAGATTTFALIKVGSSFVKKPEDSETDGRI